MTPPADGLTDVGELEAFLDELVSAQLRTNHIAGAAVAVVEDGQLLFAKGYGDANRAEQKPVVVEQTLFRTDSTGKLFVWTAVMQLVEEGKLDLEADVNSYLDFKIPATFPQPITLAHLMSHSAGFDDRGYLYAHRAADLEPTGAWLARNIPARVRLPGVVSGYSNYGVGLAGYIVERASGLPFEQYMEKRIFEPLGMHRSTFRQPVPPDLEPDVTTNYNYAGGEFSARPFQYLRIPAAGEGHTTVTDMARFMIAHLQTGDSPLFKASTRRQMHSRLFAHDPRVSGIAYGFVETTQNNLRLLRHEGNSPGMSSTALFLIPEEQLGVYVAFNSNGGFGPGEEFRRTFLDHYFPVQPAAPQPASLTEPQVNALEGSYRSTRMFYTSFGKVMRLLGGNYADVTVSANADGGFTTQGIGSSPLHWRAVDPQMLRLADGALNGVGDLVFGADEKGQINRLFVGNNPYRAYEKVAWFETIVFQAIWLALCELIFLFALLALPVGWLLRRQRSAAPHPLAAWLLAGACTLALVFPIALALTFEEALLYGVTPALMIALTLPLVAIGFAMGALFLAINDWKAMNRIGRIHYGAVMAAMVAFAGWLNYWNLLGWRL